MITIKDVSLELGISAHAIRFYEKEGMVEIPRNKQGIRYFDKKSLEILRAIVHYRRVGMSLEDIRKILAEFHNHKLSTELLKKTRVKLEKQIQDLKETHAYLVEKIKIHKSLADLQEKGLDREARTQAYYDIKNDSKK